MMFTSGTQALTGRTVSHDPWAYTSRVTGARGDLETAERLSIPVDYDPRPEFAVLDNPILAGFRDAIDSGEYEATRLARLWLGLMERGYRFAEDVGLYTQEQRDHAKRVLTRLANLERGL